MASLDIHESDDDASASTTTPPVHETQDSVRSVSDASAAARTTAAAAAEQATSAIAVDQPPAVSAEVSDSPVITTLPPPQTTTTPLPQISASPLDQPSTSAAESRENNDLEVCDDDFGEDADSLTITSFLSHRCPYYRTRMVPTHYKKYKAHGVQCFYKLSRSYDDGINVREYVRLVLWKLTEELSKSLLYSHIGIHVGYKNCNLKDTRKNVKFIPRTDLTILDLLLPFEKEYLGTLKRYNEVIIVEHCFTPNVDHRYSNVPAITLD